MKAWIYIFKNTKTGMFYVGQTTDPKERRARHLCELKAKRHKSKALQEAWDAQGGEGFEFEILYELRDAMSALDVEQFVLTQYGDKCYNASRYANTPHKGKFGSAHPCAGPKSEEHIEKIQAGLRTYYSEHDHTRKGVPRTEEEKRKISQAQIGKLVSAETREKQRLAHLGKVWTEEEKQKLRKPKGRTEEHAAKFNKSVIELTTGEVFPSVKAVKERFGISPGFFAKIIAADRPVKKGRLAGLHFRYV